MTLLNFLYMFHLSKVLLDLSMYKYQFGLKKKKKKKKKKKRKSKAIKPGPVALRG